MFQTFKVLGSLRHVGAGSRILLLLAGCFLTTLSLVARPNIVLIVTADQLYNLDQDPGETQNLAESPAHATILKEMKRRLSAHLRYTPDRPFGEFTRSEQ